MTTSSSRLNPESISSLDEGLRRRYSERFQRLGADPRALGWDTRENQRARFATAVRSINFRDKSVLDIGCGLADFHDFLAENPETRARHYTGFDINEDFIEHCRRRLPDSAFEQRNVLTDPPDGLRWDIVTAFGVLNLRLADIDNRVFARAMMESAFALCEEAVAIDMLTSRRDEAYPAEDFVYYYDPGEMLSVALEITPHVMLRHDRPSIPQREMLIVLRRWP